MQFTKMQGLGNDFVVVDCLRQRFPEAEWPRLAQRLCDRHFGIGADGLLLVLPSKVALFRMRIINADGSEAEMCGNGIRCVAKYLYDRALTTERQFGIETLAGVRRPKLIVENKRVRAVRVDMGEPRLNRADIPMRGEPRESPVIGEKLKVEGTKYEITGVSMGNPHCVIFVDHVERFEVDKVGPKIENHSSFPQRTNVEFVEVLNSQELRMRVWERGAGQTIACGTGACAAAVAAALNKRANRRVTVHLDGGDLLIEWQGNNHVFMTGPAEEVFVGEIEI